MVIKSTFDDIKFQEFCISLGQARQEWEGIGLAAPQVGHMLAVISLDPEIFGNPDSIATLMINPRIIGYTGKQKVGIEKCLSLPDIRCIVPRRNGIRMKYMTLDGKSHGLQCIGLLSRVIQHEIDHLRGVLITDYGMPIEDEKFKDVAKDLKGL